MVAHDHHLGRLLERALERRLDHVVALLELLARGETPGSVERKSAAGLA